MIRKRYRPEIDGLRALAVMGVILFHFGLGFPGGYVGVDVFFVISGFLITGIIHRQVLERKFSFLDFSVRRIKRILPAVSIMVAVSLLVGYLVLTPLGLIDFAETMRAKSLIAANFHFAGAEGYFEEVSDLR